MDRLTNPEKTRYSLMSEVCPRGPFYVHVAFIHMQPIKYI